MGGAECIWVWGKHEKLEESSSSGKVRVAWYGIPTFTSELLLVVMLSAELGVRLAATAFCSTFRAGLPYVYLGVGECV